MAPDKRSYDDWFSAESQETRVEAQETRVEAQKILLIPE